MLRTALFLVVLSSLSSSVAAQPKLVAASSQEPASAPPEAPVGYGALPGGFLAADAAVLPGGRFGLLALAGYGYRDGIITSTDRLRRAVGSLGLAYSVVDSLAVGVTLDGRYDSHSTGDDGYVGDPRFFTRFALQRGALGLGAQLVVWVPGKEAPSFALEATTVEGRALVSAALGPARASLNLGVRYDNSDATVTDPQDLSPQDQVSLGVSAFHAIVVGGRIALPLGRGFLSAEVLADKFLGDGAPGATVRAELSGGVRISAGVSLLAYAQLATAPDARMALDLGGPVPLVPYESAVSFGLGLETRFGGEAPAREVREIASTPAPEEEAPKPPRLAALRGVVVDDTGAPVAGAKVEIEVDGRPAASTVTDGKGAYRVPELAPGAAKIRIAMPGKEPRETLLSLVGGDNDAPKVQLDPELPPGELRGNVRTRVGGKPIAGATVVVNPGNYTAQTGSDGSFALEVPPGKYTITTTADGYAPQVIEAVVDQDGVAVKFINLDKPKKE